MFSSPVDEYPWYGILQDVSFISNLRRDTGTERLCPLHKWVLLQHYNLTSAL